MSEAEREYTEAELTGEEAPEGAPSTGTEEVVPGEVPVPPKKEEAAPVEPEKVEAPELKKEPVPDLRTVPLAALREERERRKDLQRRIEELEGKLSTPQKDPKTLVNEDPEGAIVALYQQINDLKAELNRRDIEAKIKTEVPDFVQKAPVMEEYLLSQGFSEESIVKMIGASGEDVPKFLRIIDKAASAPDMNKLRSDIAAELTAKITEQVTRELMAKFNLAAEDINLSKLPGHGSGSKIIAHTEEEFAKLTPEDQEKWLSGQT